MCQATRWTRAFTTAALLALGGAHPASAQQPTPSAPDAAPAIAFVNVNLIPMDRQTVVPGQTVLIRGGRVVAIGPATGSVVPDGTTVVDGAGRYLIPGLTDAHVHLTTDMPWAPARSDFGDAPLYLAYGVTTVLNLRGTPTQLEWRRRIEAGELVGPTIYTTGEFVNEPRVNTPDEVKREIVAQAREGYDLIKFHETWTPAAGFTTTTGLSLPAYMQMIEAAREIGIPLIGHAPANLGLEALLRARQPLAHMGTLSNIYFMPMTSNQGLLLLTAGTLLVLIVAVVTWGAAAIIGSWRKALPRRLPALSRLRTVTSWVLLAGVLALACVALLLPGGPLFESFTLRLIFTALGVFIPAAVMALAVLTIRIWRDTAASRVARMQASLVTLATLGLAYALLIFWVPVIWRSSDSGIERLANRLRDAGISVQTTLGVYEMLSPPAWSRLVQDPAINYLRADTQARWRGQRPPGFPVTFFAGRYDEFMNKVAGTLHRAGVPLMAGTDAMGLPLIAPGSSLHRELQLLTENGLTPYEAIRTATINPAIFLGKDTEFGTVSVGKRADLLLIDGNPLQNIALLSQPIGVMVRGKWLPRDQLQQMLAALAQRA